MSFWSPSALNNWTECLLMGLGLSLGAFELWVYDRGGGRNFNATQFEV